MSIIQQRIEAARAGTNPTVICRVPSGWVVLGDSQLLRGYSLLLADPMVPSLNALAPEPRAQFLHDMAVLGDAVLEVTGALRVNYEILGNLDPFLHAHVFPRYATEPDDMRVKPIWLYSEEIRDSVKFDRERDAELMGQIAAAILSRI